MPKPRRKVHFTRGGRRVKCGRFAKKTLSDTRDRKKVTCANCRRGLAAEAK